MKIEAHDIFMHTEYAELERTKQEFNLEWRESVQRGLDIATKQEIETESTLSLIEKVKYELINELLQTFGIKSSAPSTEGLVSCTKEYELEFKRLGIPTMELTYTETKERHESLSATMKGCVRTSDGREIALNLDLSMSQSFYSKVEKSQTVFTDPLVINFDGKLPEVEDMSFSFDIDSDGESDQISRLSSGSGFLALDKNENGVIDDGSELFGTKSGNGFADLAVYDEDGNGWIDEGDSVFDRLRIWENSGESSRLLALGEVGVGAIYLGSAKSDFEYRNPRGDVLGALRSTGLFLFEDGRGGNISQIDFVKNRENENIGLKELLRQSPEDRLSMDH